MLDINITALIQALNFFIAVIVLNCLLIRPVREIIRQRKAQMDDMAASAEAFARSANDELAAYEDSLSQTRRAAVQARAGARQDALNAQQALLADAGKRAQEQLAKAKQALAQEAQNARTALTKQVKPLAAKAVARILG